MLYIFYIYNIYMHHVDLGLLYILDLGLLRCLCLGLLSVYCWPCEGISVGPNQIGLVSLFILLYFFHHIYFLCALLLHPLSPLCPYKKRKRHQRLLSPYMQRRQVRMQ